MQDYAVIKSLIDTLRHPDDGVRFDAILELRKLIDVRATEDLISILYDAESISPEHFDDLRFEVTNLILQCGPPAIHRLAFEVESENQRVRETVAYSLQSAGEPALAGLMRALLNEDKRISLLARNTFAEIGEAAIPYLAAILNNSSPNVRLEALRTICMLLEDEAKPYAGALVNDPDNQVRSLAQDLIASLSER